MKPVDLSLTAFLEKLDAQLGELPPARRAEIGSETRAHLEAMIAARRADGMDEEAAWKSARDAFGDPALIGRSLAQEWKRMPVLEIAGTPEGRRRTASRSALLLVLLAIPVFLGLSPWVQAHHWRGPLLLVLTPAIWLFSRWFTRQSDVPMTAANYFGQIFGFWVGMSLAIKFQFVAELRGTALDAAFRAWFSPSVLTICFLSILWGHWENRRGISRVGYGSDGAVAGGVAQANALQGLVLSTAIPCAGALLMGGEYLGLDYALGLCGCNVAINLGIWRWLR